MAAHQHRASQLSAVDLGKAYGSFHALRDLNLTIRAGEFVTLLGPSGSGKTTFLMSLAGFTDPTSGRIEEDGVDITHRPADKRNFGMVFQGYALFPHLSVADNVAFPLKVRKVPSADIAKRVDEMVKRVGLAGHAHKRPDGLSGGQQQRVALARALVFDPAVLLLDEPFNGMDPRQRMHLMDLLQRMAAGGRSVLFSSHILEEVEQLAGSIQVMVAGRHAASGDFREIRRLMTEKPHQYTIRSSDNRRLASALVADVSTSAVQLVGAQRPDGVAGDHSAALHVEAVDVARFVKALPWLAQQTGVRLLEVSPTDESLESVFAYLVTRS